ncbi:cupin domain-containing protein [Streptomyces hygroscopicus]|uniref:cupin domain-containing protein n=1 Tax=Streptomyces hygroscopicus TaxID=1912 RepID=UPI00223EEC9C|nr:cupin domain-containing protein [Streptomyces hygroscopicus]
MQTFTLDETQLSHEYGIGIGRWERYEKTQRLPFDAMWCRIPAHSESAQDNHPEVELAIVVGGTAVFTVDGEDITVEPGTAVLLSPGERHVIKAAEDPVRILSVYWLPAASGSGEAR